MMMWLRRLLFEKARLRARNAELEDQLARERGLRQLDSMYHEQEIAVAVREGLRARLDLAQRDADDDREPPTVLH